MKTWTKPSFSEIQMNAEIGSYQSDDGGVDRISRVKSSEAGQRAVQSELANTRVVPPAA